VAEVPPLPPATQAAGYCESIRNKSVVHLPEQRARQQETAKLDPLLLEAGAAGTKPPPEKDVQHSTLFHVA